MKHEFALFYPELPPTENTILLKEKNLVHRISHVLRLQKESVFILFTATHWARVSLTSLSKKEILITVKERGCNKEKKYTCTVLLPILKKDALASAIYQCTAAGATHIQLVITGKTRTFSGEKEQERLQKIIIAAAEQSKNFLLPTLYPPKKLAPLLEELSKKSQILKLYADTTGKPLLPLLSTKKYKNACIMVGPEGDLLHEEKEALKKYEFLFCKLTTTILTAEQAVSLFTGIICLEQEN